MTVLSPAPLLVQELAEPAAARNGIRLLLVRDDLTHPELPGNKWRKLRYNLAEAHRQGHTTLLTFGGAYSNHLAAVAAAGRLHGFQTIGLVRGEPAAALNPTLTQARADGMALHFLSRDAYRRKQEPEFVAGLLRQLGPAYVLPEGGTNALALPGCAELAAELRAQTSFDFLCVACGTGGTLAGLVTGLSGTEQAVGFPVLTGGEFLQAEVDALTRQATGRAYTNFSWQTGFHLGGYAKYSAELMTFIEAFEQRHGVLLDPVYTGKLLFGVLTLLNQNFFPLGSSVAVVHSGGLQGWAGFRQRFSHRSSWWPKVSD
ncbi:pyridoxal-phosphate dependent enzyme [Hymenobacter sp. BT175]|uniref:1-aminocyclopropane-1-carboxylate deaminase/D-cysteine desulfhydrase n=1 Tax=Hymenobacter translucens TaxID=2886507 RepID=UPI001D0E0C28|nr:pyridoxal-phosphate dependent enzyme [Hymenobacter translucens]MCC2546088.1 pyridoxal-phosphate dependent enzyme [Hymenobacter translucens]